VVRVEVSNTGDRGGDEVVQVYIRDPVSSVTRPVLELKDFVRVDVPAGQTRQVTFRLPAGGFGFFDRSLDYVVEEGEIEILVGTSSASASTVGTVTVVPDPSGSPARKAFEGSTQVD
jgi:beta-glucosidase